MSYGADTLARTRDLLSTTAQRIWLVRHRNRPHIRDACRCIGHAVTRSARSSIGNALAYRKSAIWRFFVLRGCQKESGLRRSRMPDRTASGSKARYCTAFLSEEAGATARSPRFLRIVERATTRAASVLSALRTALSPLAFQ